MAFLEKFAPDEREMLVSLPYRAGIWIGMADSTGGRTASAEESEALENVIRTLGRGPFKSAFAHEVMAETVIRRKDWEKWSENTDDVPDACARAVVLVGAKLGAHDLDGYRENIMKIAVAVARAFREYDYTASAAQRAATYVKLAADRVIGALTGQDYESDEILNISYAEDMSLAKLAAALGLETQDTGGAAAPDGKK